MIIDERITTFIHSLETPESPLLEEIEERALADHVPIIRKETQSAKWTAISMLIPTGVGMAACFLFTSIVRLLGLV